MCVCARACACVIKQLYDAAQLRRVYVCASVACAMWLREIVAIEYLLFPSPE